MAQGMSERVISVRNSQQMEVLMGFCPMWGDAPTVGRLVIGREPLSTRLHGACLPVFTKAPRVLPEDAGVVGIVLVGSSALSREQMASLRVPVLMLPELPERCLGKIALIDPKTGTLFVSPDLQTVALYTKELGRDCCRMGFSTTGMGVRTEGARLCFRDHGAHGITIESDGWLIDRRRTALPASDAEEHLYTIYCDVADCAMGTPVTVRLSFDRTNPEGERFRAHLRSIFRAAVYGKFSILLDGFLTEKDISGCLAQIHRIFCELESEGREFNGYIPRGLLIDRPLLLFSHRLGEGLDFLCIDPDRLRDGLCGSACTDEIWQEIGAVLTAQLARLEHLPKLALLRDSFPPYALCKSLLTSGMREWLVSSDRIFETRGYLRELLLSDEGETEKIFSKN